MTIGFKVGSLEVIVESSSCKLPVLILGAPVGDNGEAYELSPDKTIALGIADAVCSSWIESRF